VSKTDAMTYDPTFIDGNGIPISNSIVLKDSEILDHLVDLTSLTFGNVPETYYAVFTLHEYNVTYIFDVDAYTDNPSDLTTFEI